jgi:hypothetical protein
LDWLAVLFALVGCAGNGDPRGETAPLRRELAEVVAVRARVVAIDAAKRLVTLGDESGGEAVFYADAAVKNLPQVRVGDELAGELAEALVLELRQPTDAKREAGPSILEVSAVADPGQKPAGLFVRRIQAVLFVESLDPAAGTASIRGPAGNVRVVPVRDPRNFERVKAGDSIVATYLESLRLEVVAPPQP